MLIRIPTHKPVCTELKQMFFVLVFPFMIKVRMTAKDYLLKYKAS